MKKLEKTLIVLLLVPILSYGQIIKKTDDSLLIQCGDCVKFLKDTLVAKHCFDSLRLRHGYWQEEIMEGEELLTFDEISPEILLTEGFRSGFYNHGKKEGIWEIYVKKEIVAHMLYENDTLLFQVTYKSKQIKSIVRTRIIERICNNTGNRILIRRFKSDAFYFWKRGKLRYLRHLAPDGVLIERYL